MSTKWSTGLATYSCTVENIESTSCFIPHTFSRYKWIELYLTVYYLTLLLLFNNLITSVLMFSGICCVLETNPFKDGENENEKGKS